MEIRFNINEEDLIQYNLYQASTLKSIKRAVMLQRFVPAVIFIVAGFLFSNKDSSSYYISIMSFVLLAIIWIGFYPLYFKRHVTKSMNKIFKKDESKKLFGNYSIKLDDKRVLEISPSGKNSTDWEKIKGLVEYKGYLFIILTELTAYIVPPKAFKDENKKQDFVKLINNKIKNNEV
ncbi:YcxB family protein [Clostridium fallax]|uniref:YcxB-like protein n=1 Tax=Clostridium fallax TaxID=1533 RepID=A0A1M4W9G3_9CLOT|nr:YcxB family protein [Clostridium fallax]SHE77602.1 YcxB-like protein [Clostridium fallax]SQB05952.1 Uncharacterised protein [Clostridium fallax]